MNDHFSRKNEGIPISNLPQLFHINMAKVITTPDEVARWKWYILCLASVVTLGGYYSFDFPSVLHNQLFRHFTSSDGTMDDTAIRDNFEFNFNLLFSLYSLPNMILPLIGGVFIDKIGNNKVMFFTGSLVVLGNIILATACYFRNMPFFIFGRFLFGLGAETLQVCVNTTIAKWFIDYELALALGINLSGCKLGGVLTDWISPYIESHYGMNAASLAVVAMCLCSYAVTIALILQEPEIKLHLQNHYHHHYQDGLCDAHSVPQADYDGAYYQSIQQQHQQHVHDDIELTSSNNHHHDNNHDNNHNNSTVVRTYQSLQNHRHSLSQEEAQQHQSLLLRKGKEREKEGAEREEDAEEEEEEERLPTNCWEGEHLVIHQINQVYYDLKGLNLSTWNIFIVTFLMYGIFIPFSNIANVVLLEVYFGLHDVHIVNNPELQDQVHQAEMQAAWLQSVPYFLTLFSNPLLGWLVDYIGFRTGQLCLATVLLVVAHGFIYAWPAIGAVLPLCLIGLSYRLVGPLVNAFIVANHILYDMM